MTIFSRSCRLRRLVCACMSFSLVFGNGAAWGATVPLRTYLKSEYPHASQVDIPRPNVLFLLDTGSPMVFSPKGIMPLETDGYSTTDRAELLKECTYGSGGRPLNENVNVDHSRYGRDLDNSNNRIGDPDCYYTSDPSKPYFLTFKNSNYHTNLPPGVNVGTVVSGYPKYSNSPYPSQLFQPNEQVYNELVPNDSRMYMMKLVLWRLTSPENAKLLSHMNVGMATSYQEDNVSSNYIADYYKRAPYGQRPGFSYGTAPKWSIGVGSDNNSPGGNYRDSQRSLCGVYRDLYDKPVGSADWLRINRSVFKVPFDRFYTEDASTPGSFVPTQNLARFRQYIDGVESTGGGTFTNPELFADGQTPLSTSLFARPEHVGKDDINRNKLIQYAPKIISYGSDKVVLTEYTNTEGLKAGQAVGSAIDFFSPRKVSSGTADGLAFSADKAGYFPVTGSCQSNWVVIFTAGNDEANAPRTAAAAALELYKNTLTMRGREKRNNVWQEKEYAMDEGVRTLVVGFVDPTASDDNSVKLRKSLNDIAAHGQPKKEGGQWVKDETKKALFANDVPALIKALEDVFKLIDAESRKAPSGSPLIKSDEGGGFSGKIFNAGYQAKPYDQWLATFERRKVVSVIGNRITTERVWEAGEKMRGVGDARPLYISTGASGDVSVNVDRLKNLPSSTLTSLTGAPNAKAEDFRKWLLLPPGTSSADPTPLGDMQNSNILFVSSGDNEVLYVHTNRGVLHALDAETGSEIWGFIPPNVLQGRVHVMKFDGNEWYGGDGKEERRSMPVALLDGPLVSGMSQGRRLLLGTLGRGGTGLYAMDVTDVRPGTEPRFLWAIENARYEQKETPLSKGLRRWGAAAASGNFGYEDLGLSLPGVTLLDASGEVGTIGVLPGGLGHTLGTDSQGKAIFILNPLNGAILKKLSALTPSAPLGMALAPVVPVRTDANVLEGFLTGDSLGNVLHGNVQGTVDTWTLKSLFRLTTVAANSIPEGRPVAHSKAFLRLRNASLNQTAIIGATADVLAPGSATDSNRKVHNDQQFIFCLRQERLTGNERTKDLLPLSDADINTVWENPGLLSADQKGWALRLKASDDVYEDEYATTAPIFSEGEIIVATFRPRKAQSAACAVLRETGNARFYFLDVETGKSLSKSVELENVKIVGVTELEKGFAFAAAELEDGAMQTFLDSPDGKEFTYDPDSGAGGREKDPKTPSSNLKGVPYVDFWRDVVFE